MSDLDPAVDPDRDLDGAVADRITAYRPAATPPFDRLRARRRRRLVTGAGTAVGAAALVAAVLVVPTRLGGDDPPAALAPPGQRPSIATSPSAPSSARDAYQLWRSRGGPDYTMRYTRSCFCPITGPVTVTVVGGRVLSPTGTPASGIRTIDQLFTLILSGEADRVEATYDPVYGYPRTLDVDMVIDAIDDEARYRVTDYRPLPPP